MKNSVHSNQDIDVFVNEKDIEEGLPGNESCCALALAVNRAVLSDCVDERYQDNTDVTCIVNANEIEVHYNDEFVFCLETDEWCEINDFIEGFDLRDEDGDYLKEVEPTAFTLTVNPD